MIKKNNAAVVLVVVAGLLFTGAAAAASAAADSQLELAKKSGCTACHAIDKKLVGPAFTDVAAKYKTQKNADIMLAAKIKKGGSGVWGVIPMPPNSAVTDENILILAKWVLTQ